MGAAYFESLYQAKADPWNFETSGYEREKYAESLAALPRESFGTALEIGCSIGVFTAMLAPRCGRLLAMDPSATALLRARTRCESAGVEFRQGAVPADWPEGVFDLILLSEVLYYLVAEDAARVARCARAALAPGGAVLLVHYLGETNYPLPGDQAAGIFIAESGLLVALALRRAGFRLDLLAG